MTDRITDTQRERYRKNFIERKKKEEVRDKYFYSYIQSEKDKEKIYWV